MKLTLSATRPLRSPLSALSSLFRYLMMAVTPVVALLASCSDSESDEAEALPGEIKSFIARYFPNSAISSCSISPTTYHVSISEGPGLTFGHNCQWEAVNGYGVALPQVFLFDQMPPALYQYLEAMSQLGDVMSVVRDSSVISIELSDGRILYDIDKDTISEPSSATASLRPRMGFAATIAAIMFW